MDINEVVDLTCNETNAWESPSGGTEMPIHNQPINENEVCTDQDKEAMVSTLDSSSTPVVGMKFYSENEAYNFYNEYARRLGFGIKKFHVERRKDGTLKFKSFTCCKQGLRQQHKTHVTKKPQPITRTDCKACVEFKIDTNGEWTLWRLELNHNHPMTSPGKTHMLRSHRRILPCQRCIINQTTKYAKCGDASNLCVDTISSSAEESLFSLYSRVCQKVYRILTKNAHSREALVWLEQSLDKLNLQVEEILRNDKEFEKSNDCPIVASNMNITTKAPLAKKGPKEKRKEDILERHAKKANSSGSKEVASSVPLSSTCAPPQEPEDLSC